MCPKDAYSCRAQCVLLRPAVRPMQCGRSQAQGIGRAAEVRARQCQMHTHWDLPGDMNRGIRLDSFRAPVCSQTGEMEISNSRAKSPNCGPFFEPPFEPPFGPLLQRRRLLGRTSNGRPLASAGPSRGAPAQWERLGPPIWSEGKVAGPDEP